MTWLSNLYAWFTGAGWDQIAGVLAAFILFFDRLAKLIPTSTTSNILSFLQKVATFLGIKVPDVQ